MNIGIVGSGKMGSAIFRLLSTGPHNITLLAIDREEADKNEKRYLKGLNRSLKRGKLTEDEFRRKKESSRFTHWVEDLASSELVIEAIFEDYHEKAAIFHKLESVVEKNAVLVTNTSSISSQTMVKLRPLSNLHSALSKLSSINLTVIGILANSSAIKNR